MNRLVCACLLVALVVGLLPATTVAAADDWDVGNGHFFTQTGGGGGKGYLVSDEGGIRFWTEFKRLGGLQAVGYPASQRFAWDGYTVQVFQRVIFQWRPESQSVAFVNVFDRLHDLGKDEWLLKVRQTPGPIKLDEQGKSWDDIVKGRLAILSEYPAVKAKYYDVVGDPIQANGLPTSAVTDMGNHFALRCQRVVFQQWKEDVPWATKGMVTVALGGDIAKEASILPDQAALQPTTSDRGTASQPPPADAWALHDDAEKSFKFPSGWRLSTGKSGYSYYNAPSDRAGIRFAPPFTVGPNLKEPSDYIIRLTPLNVVDWGLLPGDVTAAKGTTGGYPGYALGYHTLGGNPILCAGVFVRRGNNVYHIEVFADEAKWSTYEPLFVEVLKSFVPKRG